MSYNGKGCNKDISQPTKRQKSNRVFGFDHKELQLALEKRASLPKQWEDVSKFYKLSKGASIIEKNVYLKGFKSTVIFAQYECGTGSFIRQDGVILTCAHCLGDNPEVDIKKILVCMDGQIILAKSLVVDTTLDLAAMKVIAIFNDETKQMVTVNDNLNFPYVTIASSVDNGDTLLCFGQPGVDDLESKTEKKTGYDVLVKSQGMVVQVPRDKKSKTLVHDCWTYWGHSGASLLNEGDT